ncbi:MAG: RNA-binding domain-containing protein [Infirmifilum sp.]
MKKSRVAVSVEISTSAHATEDEERVIKAMLNILPEELRSEELSNLRKNLSYGFYGNPIVLFNLELLEEKADKVVFYVFSRMHREDLEEVFNDFENRFAKGRLYLRFDKQEAYYGELKLSSADEIIRCIIKFKPHIRKPEDIKIALKEQGITI